MFQLKRTEEEIDNEIQKIYDAKEGSSKWPGMSYEDGLIAMLDWLLGRSDDDPMEDE